MKMSLASFDSSELPAESIDNQVVMHTYRQQSIDNKQPI
jgi:hypothetical protein